MAPESLPEPEVARKNYPGTAPLLNIHNHRLRLYADPSRVVVRPFHIAWQAQEIAASRPARLVNEVLRMEEHTAREQLEAVLKDFEERSEEHTSELQSLMRISYAVFCLQKKKIKTLKK